jgi:hypothetical protein
MDANREKDPRTFTYRAFVRLYTRAKSSCMNDSVGERLEPIAGFDPR